MAARDSETAKDYWIIWPALYLQAEWTAPVWDCFDLGVRLVRLDDAARAKMDAELGNGRIHAGRAFREDLQWGIAFHAGARTTQFVPEELAGRNFRFLVENLIVQDFLLALQLVRQTAVLCPVRFEAEFDDDRLVAESIRSADDYDIALFERPAVEWEEPFGDGDMQLLAELWSALAALRDFDRLFSSPFKVRLFAELDQEVTAQLERWPRKLVGSLAVDDAQKEAFVRQYCAAIADGEREQLATELLSRKLKHHTRMAHRVGRGLDVFAQAFVLSPLHSFLSMCLVLEVLFTTESGGNRQQLLNRVPRVACRDSHEVAATRRRVGKAYTTRGYIVHGSKTIGQLRDIERSELFDLARLSLQGILTDPSVLHLYSLDDPKEHQLRQYLASLQTPP